MAYEREQILRCARDMYVPLLNKVYKRFLSDAPYTVSDTVGYECTRIEELFRPLWGIAPLINETDMKIPTEDGEISAAELINTVILRGTSKTDKLRFDRYVADKYTFANQSVTEIAAYLTAVFFAKEKLWNVLSDTEKEQISEFILRYARYALKNSWPNNHYWYPVICIEILKNLGYSYDGIEDDLENGYKNLDSLYVDNGWYADGVFGRFDFYHAWAHHTYCLLWILIKDKNSERAELYRKRAEEYIKYYIHFFDFDGGMAAYGRSLSYRFAAISIFGLAAAAGCNIDYGVAKTVVTRNIDYFFKNSLPTADKTFPVGYLYRSDGFGENYQSEGASCCYTQGFMCLLAKNDNPLWTSDAKPLPIEVSDYKIKAPLNGVTTLLCGENSVNGVTFYNNSIHYYQDSRFGHRFNDMSAYYGKFAYNSRSGFGISTRDLIGGDNMLSLVTPDGRMFSERSAFTDLGESDGVMVSRHIPFSNDPETVVTTYLLPLSNGWHVRIHLLSLSREYYVTEGGFSIGFCDDSHTFSKDTLIYKSQTSRLVPYGIKGTVSKAAIAPGMHLLKPQAAYPRFVSEKPLKARCVLAVAVGFSASGTLCDAPEIKLKDGCAEITFKDYKKTVIF